MAVLKKIFSSLRKLFGKKKQRRKAKRKVRKKSLSSRRAPRKSLGKSRPAQPSRKTQPSGQPVGEITHFFAKIQVVVVKMTKGNLAVGDNVRIYGKSTDFIQTVRSMQIESVDVRSARSGQLIGLKVEREAKVGDKLYRLVV